MTSLAKAVKPSSSNTDDHSFIRPISVPKTSRLHSVSSKPISSTNRRCESSIKKATSYQGLTDNASLKSNTRTLSVRSLSGSSSDLSCDGRSRTTARSAVSDNCLANNSNSSSNSDLSTNSVGGRLVSSSSKTSKSEGMKKATSIESSKSEQPLKSGGRLTSQKQHPRKGQPQQPSTPTMSRPGKRRQHIQSQLINPDTRHIPQSNVHRISVNSDLLSRVEKEKKQYEARISDLIQVAETRKIEIEKLKIENRSVKEELAQSRLVSDEADRRVESLRCKLTSLEQVNTDGKVTNDAVDADNKSNESSSNHNGSTNTLPHSPTHHHGFSFRHDSTEHSSSPESLATTTRLTPGGLSSCPTIPPPSSTLSSDNGLDHLGSMHSINFDHASAIRLSTGQGQGREGNSSLSTLQGRLLQMEEANYTTTEELQATLQELWDLQRCVDDAQEEKHSLAFEREILLEALSTQTNKLEHCRFQIELLKYLLLQTGGGNSALPDDVSSEREQHFCDLYASVEQEKQILLGQNNDLAQSSDSLAKECRILTEKASQLQDAYDALQTDYSSLAHKYKIVTSERAAKYLDSLPPSSGTGDASMSPNNRNDSPPPPPTSCSQCQSLTDQLTHAKSRLDLAEAEHDRQATEWRLYERDLLKTVSVADTLRLEADCEVDKLKTKVETLSQENEKYNSEAVNYRAEIEQLKQSIDQLTLRLQTPPPVVVVPAESNGGCDTSTVSPTDQIEVAAMSSSSTIKVPRSEPTTASLTASAKTLAQPKASSVTMLSGTNSSIPGTATINAGGVNRMAASSFGLLSGQAANSRHHALSPGGPVGGAGGRPSSAAAVNGPTVRNLIQSIENRVKAVQHQQRGLSGVGTQIYSTATAARSSPAVGTVASSGGRIHLGNTNTPSRGVIKPLPPVTNGAPLNGTSAAAPGGPPSTPRSGVKHVRRVSVAVVKNGCHTIDHNSDSSSPATIDNKRGTPLRRNNSIFTMSSTSNGSSSSTTHAPSSSNGRMLPSRSGNVDLNANSSSTLPSSDTAANLPDTPPTTSGLVDGDSINDSPSSLLQPSGSSNQPLDPLQELVKQTGAGSKRNALLHWVKSRTASVSSNPHQVPVLDISNFSTSWNNGLALCALLSTYLPEKINWAGLVANATVVGGGGSSAPLVVDKRRCFETAFAAAESVGIPTTLDLHYMLQTHRPDWSMVMAYIVDIYKHFEVDSVAS